MMDGQVVMILVALFAGLVIGYALGVVRTLIALARHRLRGN